MTKYNSVFIIFLLFAVNSTLHPETPVTIIATGDMMLGSWCQDVIIENGYNYPFTKIDSVLQNGDIVFTNLEAPFGNTGEPFPKKYNFQVNPELIKVLGSGKINIVSLANNHIMDYGAESLVQTINLLKADNNHYKTTRNHNV